MRMETLLLYASLGLCLITPVLCVKIKSEDKKRKIGFILFLIITSFLLVDVLLMISYQLRSDFRFQYVYSHISIDLKESYKISALWSGQEGSFLLWSFIMAIFGIVITRIKINEIGKVIASYAVLCNIILILTVKSYPFQIAKITMTDGLGLSETLQSPWMVVHPPLVFIGYSAMAVLLSFATVIKKDNCIDNLEGTIKQWVRISLLFLGAGIFTGSIWAYRALGWGGYWSWDPIENAALVPWLILSTYLHGKNRLCRMDCIIPFTLAVFGTFLTRSGILQDKSVHSYVGGDDSILIFSIFAAFLILVVIFIIISIIEKRKDNKLLNTHISWNYMNCFRLATYIYASFIFIGTIFPLLKNISIPIKYYNYISIVYVIIITFLFLSRFVEVLLKNFIVICILNTLLIILVLFTFHTKSIWLLLLWLVFLPAWMLCAKVNFKRLPYTISHLAIIFMFVGAIASSGLSEKRVVMADITDSDTQIANHSISVNQLQKQESMILSSITQDIIINQTEIEQIDKNTMLIYYTTKPLIILFWIGGGLFILCMLFYILHFKRTKE